MLTFVIRSFFKTCLLPYSMLLCLFLTRHLLVGLSTDSAKVLDVDDFFISPISTLAASLSCHFFVADIYTIDEQLMETFSAYLSTLFDVISTTVVIAGVSPTFVFCLIPMILFYIHEQAFFTVRDIYEAILHAIL